MKILVQRRRSYVVPLLVILVFCAAAAAGWRYVQDLRARQVEAINDLTTERRQLLDDYRLLLEEKRQAEQKVDMLEQTGEVDARAYAKVNEHLKSLQKEIVDLNEEVTFYRDIVSDSGGSSVTIKQFGIRATEDAGNFRFQLVLTRGTRNDKVVKGTVKLAIDGDVKGRKQRLRPTDLGMTKAAGLDYQFKYFQRLEGWFSLPENFIPQRVIVTVTHAENPGRPLLKSFGWAAINS